MASAQLALFIAQHATAVGAVAPLTAHHALQAISKAQVADKEDIADPAYPTA